MSDLYDTPQLVEEAIRSLSAGPYIILNCKGKALGAINGEISLISLGTPNAEHIYLIDVLALDRSTLKPGLDLISGEKKTKVVWDGRQDYSELYHGLGTPIRNVLDLQIADVMSRTMRGENEQLHIQRLGSHDLAYFLLSRWECDGLHALSGLDRAFQEHRIDGPSRKDSNVSSIRTTAHNTKWMFRPLPSALKSYASEDVQIIAALYSHFNDRGYLPTIPTLLEQSERYVSIHRDSGRPRESDIYRTSNVLLLGVLRPIENPSKICDKCTRVQSLKYFSTVNGATL